MPKQKKSASSAISSARSAARGVSIIVPMATLGFFFTLAVASAMASSAQPRAIGQLLAGDGERDHDLDDRACRPRLTRSAAASMSARTCMA